MTAANAESALTGRRVLIVEDDPFISWEMEDLISTAGAEVLGPAATVRAAMAILSAQVPDAVLLDLNLRGERSTPVAEALQANAIPFILVTGYSLSQIEESVLRNGHIVPKPVDTNQLLNMLSRITAGGGISSERSKDGSEG